MTKRKILVSNEQVNETRLINSLNSNLLKKEDKNTNSIKEESPVEEKTLYSIMKEREKALTETEPATVTPQDEPDGPYAANACNCGTKIVEDNTSNFDNVESDRQRKIKYDAHADKIGYADASPSPVWNNAMVCKNLSPEAMEKLKEIIVPEAKSILKRFDNFKNTIIKDNEDSRKAVNSEIGSSATLTDYGKKMLEVGKRAGKIVTRKDTEYEMVDHPSHYNQYDIEVIDMIIKIWGPEAAALWCDITAFKYRMRMGTKPDNSIEQDIKKEQWYLNKSKEIKTSLIKENLINKN